METTFFFFRFSFTCANNVHFRSFTSQLCYPFVLSENNIISPLIPTFYFTRSVLCFAVPLWKMADPSNNYFTRIMKGVYHIDEQNFAT